MNSYAGRQGRWGGGEFCIHYSFHGGAWDRSPRCSMASPPPPSPLPHGQLDITGAQQALRKRPQGSLEWRQSGATVFALLSEGEHRELDLFKWAAGSAGDFIGVADYCASERLLLLRRAKLAICLCNERLAGLLRTIQSPFPFYSLLIVHSPRSSASAVRHQLERNNGTATGGARFFCCFFLTSPLLQRPHPAQPILNQSCRRTD